MSDKGDRQAGTLGFTRSPSEDDPRRDPRLLASIAFGALWTWWGVEAAVALYLVGLVVGLLVTLVLFSRNRLALATA